MPANWRIRCAIGLIAGLALAYADNIAFKGEASPILIVVMLLAITSVAAAVWGPGAWITASSAWLCVPTAHLIKHAAGWPDTLQPNTYTSIFMLAAFTLVVAILGTGVGLLVHRGVARNAKGKSDPSARRRD
jgi:hypothetical protein